VWRKGSRGFAFAWEFLVFRALLFFSTTKKKKEQKRTETKKSKYSTRREKQNFNAPHTQQKHEKAK
jgi:hypothetical protein